MWRKCYPVPFERQNFSPLGAGRNDITGGLYYPHVIVTVTTQRAFIKVTIFRRACKSFDAI